MSQTRLAVVDAAFKKLDKTGDGVITIDDLKGNYCADKNPLYVSGEKTKEEIITYFLNNFEIGKHVDGKVNCLN